MVVNMDSAQEAHVSAANLGMNRANLLRLSAPAADSKTGVTFGEAQVEESG